MNNPFKSMFDFLAKKFQKDTSKMLVFTGVVGWSISGLAQVAAILFNPKISDEKKSFLVPQEVMDVVMNVGTFLLITQSARMLASKLCKTGKIASSKVKNFLNSKPELKSKIGKADFDIRTVLPKNTDLVKNYDSYESFTKTFATVGAGVLSSNIITPIVRNTTAADMQKNYINNKKANEQLTFRSHGMRI